MKLLDRKLVFPDNYRFLFRLLAGNMFGIFAIWTQPIICTSRGPLFGWFCESWCMRKSFVFLSGILNWNHDKILLNRIEGQTTIQFFDEHVLCFFKMLKSFCQPVQNFVNTG